MKSGVSDAQKDYETVRDILRNIEQKKQELEDTRRANEQQEADRRLHSEQEQRRVYEDSLHQDAVRRERLRERQLENIARSQHLENEIQRSSRDQNARDQQERHEQRQIRFNNLKFDYMMRWGASFAVLGLTMSLFSCGISFIYTLPFMMKLVYGLGCTAISGALGAYLGNQRDVSLQHANNAYDVERLRLLLDNSAEMIDLRRGAVSLAWTGYFQSFTTSFSGSEAFSAGLRIAEANEEAKLEIIRPTR